MFRVTEKNLTTGKPVGEILISKMIEQRFEMKKNTLISIVGNSGEGKSYTGIKLATIVDPNFNPKEQIVYAPRQVLEVIKNAKEKGYRAVVLDEAHTTVDATKFMSIINKAINYVTSTFRKLHRLCLIIIAPNITWIDKRMRELCNFYIISARSERQGQSVKTYVKIYTIGFNYQNINDQHPYISSIYFHMNGQNYQAYEFKIGAIDEQMAKDYEDMSEKYKSSVLETQLENLINDIDSSEQMANKVTNDPAKVINDILSDKHLYRALIKKKKDGTIELRKTSTKKIFSLTELELAKVEGMLEERMLAGI